MSRPALIVILLALSTRGSSGQTLWCQYDPNTSPFQEARALLSVTDPTIPGNEMETLANQLFQNYNCTERGFCNCFPQDDLRRLLEMNNTQTFADEHFNRACVMLIETARDMEEYCPRIADKDPTLTYGTFEHILTSCPGCHDDHDDGDHHSAASPQVVQDTRQYLHSFKQLLRSEDDHGHGFNWTQFDQYSQVLNDSYIPVSDCTKSFSAEQVFRSLPLHDPGHGEITQEEVPVMAAALVMRFTKGECLQDSHWHVETEDFIASLFHNYANDTTCKIHSEGLDSLLHDLAIAEHSGDGGHEEDGDDGHGHSISSLRYGFIYNMWNWWGSDVTEVVTDEDDHDHDHGEELHGVPYNASMNCYSTEALLEAFGLDIEAGLDIAEIKEVSHALMQQAAVGCKHLPPGDDGPRSDLLTQAEMYGYGTLAVFVESLCALLGLIIIKWQNTQAYKYILVVMLGLSVGTLCGDAILHLIPKVLGLHSHEAGDDHSHAGIYVEDYTWKMFTMMCAVWLFFMLQLGLEALAARKKDTNETAVEMNYTTKGDLDGIENYAYNGDVVENGKAGSKPQSNGVSNGTVKPQKTQNKGGHGHSHFGDSEIGENGQDIKAAAAVPYMILIGDGLHNFADGMAIGAAFVVGWRTGLSTTIAVFCHELPHEFGDIAAVLSAGWSPMKAMVVNLCSAFCAFIGLYIGIPVSTALDADAWILALAAGMFLYISLADIVPELVQFFRVYDKTKMFIAANFGFGLGFLIMMLIAVFEEQITF